MMSKLILASGSPRRREMFERMPWEFSCEPSAAEERIPEELSVYKAAEYLSALKAEEVWKRHKREGKVIVGSDTAVILDGVIFGKPGTVKEAADMLRQLSGRTHIVSTGVTIVRDSGRESFTSETEVTFYELSEKEIEDYIATGEPMDKAGAYGIQGYGAFLVREIKGDYYTVVGLPAAMVKKKLERIPELNI